MKTKQSNTTYITIEPNELEYRQILAAAIKYRDTEALEALRGNLHKPIRFVIQWFLYLLMTSDYDQSDYVTIYSIKVRQNQARWQQHLANLYGNDEEADKVSLLTIPAPADIYDFLL